MSISFFRIQMTKENTYNNHITPGTTIGTLLGSIMTVRSLPDVAVGFSDGTLWQCIPG